MFKNFAYFLFLIVKRIFRKQFEDYILGNSLKDARSQMQKKHYSFLRMLAADPTFEEIMNIHIASIVQAGFMASSKEGLRDRKNWVDAFNYMKGLSKNVPGAPEVQYNPLTGEKLDEKKKKTEI